MESRNGRHETAGASVIAKSIEEEIGGRRTEAGDDAPDDDRIGARDEARADSDRAPRDEETLGEVMSQRHWRARPLLALVFAAMLAAAGCSGSSPATPSPTPAPAGALMVTRVIDGDTIVVDTVGTVRLIGVDTPETVDPREPVGCFGREASAFTREVASGKMVRLDYDVDRFDRFERTLAYIYLPDGTFLNAALVQQGYGRAYTVFPFRYREEFRALEREARDARRGLWAACTGP